MRKHIRKYNIILLCSTAIKICLGLVTAVRAADMPRMDYVPVPPADARLPAVSGVNGSVGAYVCRYDGDISGGVLGTFTTPLDQAHGLQIDGALGVNDDGKLIGQASGHLFWRDPQVGLLGLYGAYVYNRTDNDGARLGVEGELYRDRITLSGITGWDFGRDKVFVNAKLGYYLTDNTKIYAGYLYEGRNIGAIGAEHLFDSTPFSVFAEGRLGEDDYKAAFAGVRLYFRGDSSPAKTKADFSGNLGIGSKISSADQIALNDTPRSLKTIDREDVVPLWMQLCGDSNPPATVAPTDPTEPTVGPTNPTEPTGEPTRPTRPTEPTMPTVGPTSQPTPPTEGTVPPTDPTEP